MCLKCMILLMRQNDNILEIILLRLLLMLLRGRGGPRGRRGDKDEEKWVPCTKLGRLVQQVSFARIYARIYAYVQRVEAR